MTGLDWNMQVRWAHFLAFGACALPWACPNGAVHRPRLLQHIMNAIRKLDLVYPNKASQMLLYAHGCAYKRSKPGSCGRFLHALPCFLGMFEANR
jgi:hypothetical protein